MMMFLSLLCIFSLALAEPPVGDGYAAARSTHTHDHHERHSSSSRASLGLSTNYGPPSTKALSQEYGPPGLRSSPSNTYGPPARISQEYAPSKSHENSGYSTGLSQEYNAPKARSQPSQEYGIPAQRSSDSYQNTPSTKYGAPELRSKPAGTYLPAQKNSDSYTPSQTYGAPELKSVSLPHSAISEDYSAKSAVSGYNAKKSFKSSHTVSRTYGTPKKTPSHSYGVPSSRSLSTSYGAPSVRNSDSYSEDVKTVSQTYAPILSESYGAPEAKSASMEYNAPELKTNDIAAPYPAARSSPSEIYGAPSAHDDSPSQHYGVPEHDSSDNQGYDYSRNSLSFEEQEEPANYEFAYAVNDAESGSDFGHKETRHENRAEGSYFVLLPDGTKQVVEYEADEEGFKPRIFLESAEARNAEGPY